MVMKSMERSDEDLEDEEKKMMASPSPSYKPDPFPYGLRMCLCQEEIEKLDPSLPPEAMQAGAIVHLHALARVTSSSMDPNGESKRLELQVTDLEIESEDAENEDAEELAEKRPRRSLRDIYTSMRKG